MRQSTSTIGSLARLNPAFARRMPPRELTGSVAAAADRRSREPRLSGAFRSGFWIGAPYPSQAGTSMPAGECTRRRAYAIGFV